MAAAGDCCSVQCSPGRQIYLEFSMFPQVAMKKHTGYAVTKISNLDCMGFDLAHMMDKAFMFGNNSISTNNFSAGDQLLPGTNNTTFSDIIFNHRLDQTPTYNADNSKLRQVCFNYEGGYHMHEFTNPTNLPIYVELIEYKPRNLMSFSTSEFVSAGISVLRIPGLYESIHSDLCDQKAWDYNLTLPSETANGTNIATGSAGGAADNTKFDKLFNELDDKGFKLGGKMPITNMRWVILNKVKVRIDPGNSYKYTVEHKPFSFTPADLIRYNDHYRIHALTDATAKTGLISGTFNPYALNPLFSRGLSVRVTGSKAFITGSSTTAEVNSFGIDTDGTEYVNNIYANSKNGGTSFSKQPINALVTHAAVITHQVTESHKFRMRSKPDNNIKFFTDYRPNAASATDVLTTDTVLNMNVETLDVEVNDF